MGAKRMLRLLSLAAVACLSAGCAFATVDVHAPTGSNMPTLVAGGPGHGREVILVAPFGDARPQRARCGMQKNGYQMDTADVRCVDEPGRWLADAFAQRLASEGYRVLRSDAVPGPSTVVVRGEVRRLFLEPTDLFFTRTVEGDFSAHLTVSSLSGLKADRTFYVKGSETDIASTEGIFQSAADDATVKIANAMTVALTELLDRFPEVGAPSATAQVTR